MMRLLILAAATLLALWLPRAAAAQTCSASVTNVDFGDPNLLSGTVDDAMATLTVTCTGIPLLSQVKMCPSIGDGTGGSSGATRTMLNGASTLGYQLYSDAARTVGWGSLDETQLGSVPSIILGSGLSTSATVTRTLYARVFGSQQTAAVGNYASLFAGSDTPFTYARAALGASSSCTGFVGTATIRPSFQVTAAALSNCSIATPDLDFGTSGVIASAILAQASMSVTCTRPTPYSVSLDGGLAAATPTARRMTSSAGDAVTYGLYRDAARALPWGADSATRASGTGTGTAQLFVVYGRVPAQTTPRPGAYADRIVATITY